MLISILQKTTITTKLTWLFAIACGISVANVYYAQPLLDSLALEFSISHAAIGGIITSTQIGSALALLFLVPLGDIINRRYLILTQLIGLVIALVIVGFAQSSLTLLIGMLSVGLLGTAMTQGLIAYAASISEGNNQGKIVGAAQSGVFIGLLLARVFAGSVSDIAGWRGVYFCSAMLMLIISIPLLKLLPNIATITNNLSYPRLLFSMFTLLRENRTLQVRGILAMLMFAAFNVFWSALVLPLSIPPYEFSHTIIGTFGLIGALGALAAAKAGVWADHGYTKRVSLFALIVMLLAWIPLSLLEQSFFALCIGIILLDMGGQALHVTSQIMIFRGSSDAHSRLVGIYMLFYAIGSGIGAITTTVTYVYIGWVGVCFLGFLITMIALLFWWLSLSYISENKVNVIAG